MGCGFGQQLPCPLLPTWSPAWPQHFGCANGGREPLWVCKHRKQRQLAPLSGEGRAGAGLIGVRGAALLPAALLLIKLQAALSSPFESFDFSSLRSPHGNGLREQGSDFHASH